MRCAAIVTACCGLIGTLTLGGCASTSSYTGPRSGFLSAGEYSMLKKATAPDGGERYAYADPTLAPYNYGQMIVNCPQFYPQPQAGEHVTVQTLEQVREYMCLALRARLGARVQLVDQPGAGVARLQIAITSIGQAGQGLDAMLDKTFGGGTTTSTTGSVSTIAIEAKLTNSVSGQPLLLVVRNGIGAKIQLTGTGRAQVTLDDLKPLIDQWSDGAAATVTEYIKAK